MIWSKIAENSSINWILQDASCWHVKEWSHSPGICFKIPDRLEALIITGAGAVAFSKEIRDLTLQSFQSWIWTEWCHESGGENSQIV